MSMTLLIILLCDRATVMDISSHFLVEDFDRGIAMTLKPIIS